MRFRALTTAFAVFAATSALAQDATGDWEIIRQPANKTVFAFVLVSTGLTIGFRCVDGVYGAVIGGLPEVSRNTKIRTLTITVNDGEPDDSHWNVATDRTVALADYPAALARELREGGAVSIIIPGGGGGGGNLRHNLTLPASSAAIDETLTACGRPLEDPRDALLPEIAANGLPDGVTWARPPRPVYPRTNYAEGYAVLTCVVDPDGKPTQCQVESEFPVDGNFAKRPAGRRRREARQPWRDPGTLRAANDRLSGQLPDALARPHHLG